MDTYWLKKPRCKSSKVVPPRTVATSHILLGHAACVTCCCRIVAKGQDRPLRAPVSSPREPDGPPHLSPWCRMPGTSCGSTGHSRILQASMEQQQQEQQGEEGSSMRAGGPRKIAISAATH
eukprot:1151434-Pelagomonas_calceolata.AAC.5